MNQTQRDYLIKTVERTYSDQIDELKSKVPDKPSLNNYIVAAFLDNTIQINDIEALKAKIRNYVLKFGHTDRLIETESDSFYRRRQMENDTDLVKLEAADLFIIPQNYLDVLKEYEDKKAELNNKIDELEAIKNTIVMKIQIGSSATMDKIILQVDNMGDLNLLNNQLKLGDGK